MIRVVINGQAEMLKEDITVAQMLESRGMAGKRVAVECNGEIVPRGRHAETPLSDGDRIEIVSAVGGG